MIPLTIQRRPLGTGLDWRWTCDTDEHHGAFVSWVELLHEKLATEMFTDIGALLAGSKDHVDAWTDAERARIERDQVRFHHMSSAGAPSVLEVSFDDFIDAVLRWFDAVDSELASKLRAIQAEWA
jgi:hypothetical protein